MMFRITKTFENRITFIFRIEGKITDNGLTDWAYEINKFKTVSGRQVILDFSQLFFIAPKAVDMLLNNMTENLYILNCSTDIRNRFHSSGLGGRMLE
ncbi:hypothetical protein L0152_24110 [bacterium]|nr:hypothetical protein [bacterium]